MGGRLHRVVAGRPVVLLGRVEDCLRALQRAQQLHAEGGDPRRAARCAFWVVFHLINQGELAQASGWLARANRLLEHEQECAERGYLLLPVALQRVAAGDYVGARRTAARAAAIGRRVADADLVALALVRHGRAMVRQGRVGEGLVLLDEAMVAVVADELSPPVAGTVYCSVIDACQEILEWRRAHEWTAALAAWCGKQPDMVTFNSYATGASFYQQAEVYRVLGDFTAAEDAYRQASHWGLEPQPGLALLRLAQGRTDAAEAAIRRVVAETSEKFRRAKLLPAHVEIMLAVGEVQAARDAADELTGITESYDTPALRAVAGHAHGAVLLAEGDARAAVVVLRGAWQVWRELEAPYEAARVRVLVGLGCRTLGREEAAAMELDAARSVFVQLGAASDLARLKALAGRETASSTHGLTARELQVLRLLAAGKTNHAIATDLVLAEKTVDRHVSNIYTKLGVSSRAAATAYAYQHRLL